MTRHWSLTLLAVAVTVVQWGCSSSKSVTIGSRTIDVEDVRLSCDRNFSALQSMNGEGKVKVETPEISQSGDFTLVLRKPDSVQIVVEGPFGIRFVNALITRTKFQAYNALQNRVITGSTTPENLKRVLRLEVSFDDIMAMLTGGTFLSEDRGSPDAVAIEGEDVLFTFSGGETLRRYLVDPSTLAIHKFQVLNSSGIMIFEQVSSDFSTVDGVVFPRTIRVTQPQRRQVFTFKYGKVTPNIQDGPISFSIPRTAQRVEWK